MRPATAMGLLLLAASLCGCAGYRLGPSNGMEAGARSIQVTPFQNQTQEPRLIEPLTTALRRNLQNDGTFRLGTRDDGDIIVSGVLIDYDRTGISFQPRDIITARDFYVVITAQVTAIDRSTGKTLLDRKVTGRTTLRAGADFQSAERQAIPILADDLAHNITSLLADGTW